MKARRDHDRTPAIVLLAAWLAAALLLLADAAAVRDYLSMVGRLGLRGQPQATTPLRQMYPEFASDAQTWVRHALSLVDGDGVRLRHTANDNAPAGRDVHWNSAWAWSIAGAGAVHARITGVPFANAVEQATLWLTPIALLCIIAIFAGWAWRRLGPLAGVFVVAAFSLHERLLEGFFPSFVDHHGLLAASVFGIVLGGYAIASGKAPRAGAIFSALSGAFGMWVSAASVVPAIACTGLGAAAAFIAQRATADRAQMEVQARAWRLWGRVGAAASLFFYVLEYFPQYLSWRLEVNHPLYSLAWLAGGELAAQAGERLAASAEERWRGPSTLAWPLAALLPVPLAVVFFGPAALLFMDPFMAQLHTAYIQEFQPLWRAPNASTAFIVRNMGLEALVLIAAVATLVVRRGRAPAIAFAAAAAAPLLALAWLQARWQLNASAAMACATLALLELWTAGRAPRVRWIALAALVAILYLPGGFLRYYGTRVAVAEHHVGKRDAMYALARDVARALRASQPEGDIVMLASPNASTSIGYYGRFRTLGTLYWENVAGLKAAAAILGARDDGEARRLLREHGVTHVAMLSEENFVGPYFELLNPDGTLEDFKRSLGVRLLAGNTVPAWLEPIPYAPPPDLPLGVQVRLYKVR